MSTETTGIAENIKLQRKHRQMNANEFEFEYKKGTDYNNGCYSALSEIL